MHACPRRRVGGGQTVRHEYEVTPSSAVQGWVMPATVIYEASSEPGSQQACSSFMDMVAARAAVWH